jgi:hypothetical protein
MRRLRVRLTKIAAQVVGHFRVHSLTRHLGEKEKTMPHETPVQPSLEALMAGYVRRQAEAEALGLGWGEGGEVTPYEAGPVQPIDPKLAWDESLAVLPFLGQSAQGLKAPAGWVNLVAQAEPQVAIAFCVGNYPQLVRDFHKLLQQIDLTNSRPSDANPLSVPNLSEWADKAAGFPQSIVALAAHRLTKQFDRARRVTNITAPAEWQAAWDNERAALAWHAGRADEAIALWRKQRQTLPVRFNLAMAALFSGRSKSVKSELEAVMAELPENSAWHHLARLYHTLCALRKTE